LDTGRIHWVIIGGESGPKARYCDIDWKMSLVKSCELYNVPVFVKQLGSHWGSSFSYKFGDYDKTFKGNDISKWPAPLQKREFPITQVA
jgi:protein gp37